MFQVYLGGFITYKKQIAGMIFCFYESPDLFDITHVEYVNIVPYCLLILQHTIGTGLECAAGLPNISKNKNIYDDLAKHRLKFEMKYIRERNAGIMEKVTRRN